MCNIEGLKCRIASDKVWVFLDTGNSEMNFTDFSTKIFVVILSRSVSVRLP